MSTRKEVIARKTYDDYCYEHLDFGLITKVDGKMAVDLEEAQEIDMSEEDIKILQEACEREFKILPGEKHIHSTGYSEGPYSIRLSLAVSALLTKYDLWYEH